MVIFTSASGAAGVVVDAESLMLLQVAEMVAFNILA
jgi:hypothetical protein